MVSGPGFTTLVDWFVDPEPSEPQRLDKTKNGSSRLAVLYSKTSLQVQLNSRVSINTITTNKQYVYIYIWICKYITHVHNIYTCIIRMHNSMYKTIYRDTNSQVDPAGLHWSPGEWQIAMQLLSTMQMWRLTADVVTVNSSSGQACGEDEHTWWIKEMDRDDLSRSLVNWVVHTK